MLTGPTSFSYSYGGSYTPQAQVKVPQVVLTHEQFCHAVRSLACKRINAQAAKPVLDAKLVYGIGTGAYRGICHYGAWHNGEQHAMIEIAATGEESVTQLAGTTIHECAHVLAPNAGHGKEWKEACARLGLMDTKAVGHDYKATDFPEELWLAIRALGEPNDGVPKFGLGMIGFTGTMRKLGTCPVGRGTRGGPRVQKGRLRLWECECEKPVKVRVASDTFAAHCDECGKPFTMRSK